MTGIYTLKQAAVILGKDVPSIIDRVRKGGIQGVKVEQTAEGFTYMLTRDSINQLGAGMKVAPNYGNLAVPAKENEQVQIDPIIMDQEIKKVGVPRATIAQVIGYGNSYLSQCIARGAIARKALDELERVYGLDQKKVIRIEQKEPEPKQEQIDTEAIRKAVCNGVVDALLVVIKDEYIANVLARTFERDVVEKALQKSIFNALNGVRNLENREKNALVPQARR